MQMARNAPRVSDLPSIREAVAFLAEPKPERTRLAQDTERVAATLAERQAAGAYNVVYEQAPRTCVVYGCDNPVTTHSRTTCDSCIALRREAERPKPKGEVVPITRAGFTAMSILQHIEQAAEDLGDLDSIGSADAERIENAIRLIQQ
jgi:hypothetical protein